MKDFIKTLTDCGWNFTPCENILPITNSRLAKAPDEFREFITMFETLSRDDDKAWFLSLKDYETEADEDSFAWNEFEKECIESAEDDDEVREITEFWENTLPVAMSVDGQYAFLGIVLNGEDRGKIVYGNEPLYEETEIVCDSFTELLSLFAEQVSGGDDDSLLSQFA